MIGEAALRQKIGGVEILREQLRHLLVAMRLANVTVRALPFEVTGHPGVDGAFTIMDVETGGFTVVAVDGLVRTVYLEDDDDVERSNVAFSQLCAVALPEAESRALIEQVLHELETSP